jgi:hypothetical protein
MKDYLLEVGVKTLGPSAIRGAILGIAGWILVKNDLLSPFGIISDATQHITTIHWDQLSTASIAALPAVIAAIIKLVQHHTTPIIKGDQPQ